MCCASAANFSYKRRMKFLADLKKRLGFGSPVRLQADAEALLADAPITRWDQDQLDRAPIAGRIAQILSARGGSEGRVFAIRGAWGFGKSSLKNLVMEALSLQHPAIQVLDFNPWQWGENDAIARALFTQMAGKLGGVHGAPAAKRAKSLRRYGGLLVGGAAQLKKAGQNATGIATLLTVAAGMSVTLGLTWPGIEAKSVALASAVFAGLALVIGYWLNWIGRDRTTDSLEEVREELVAQLSALERPLIVFVDDIDRLEPDQIRMVIRQIKANASLPNINFVLLYQPSIVEKALEPVAAGEGRDYLEKIVQASFDLPPVTGATLLSIFLNQLDELVSSFATSDNGFNQTRWGNVLKGGIEPMIRNLRDSRRLLTSIAIHVEMHRGEHAFEVNIIDFIALEALRVFEPDFHQALGLNKQLLTQSGRFSGDGRQDADKAKANALFELVDAERQPACRRLLRELFPSIEWALGGPYYGGSGRGWIREKRVCVQFMFDRYFALQLSDDILSESDFARFLKAANDRDDPHVFPAVVSDLFKRGKELALVNRLERSVEELPLDRAELLLALLFTSGERLDQDGLASMNGPFLTCWVTVDRYLARLPDSKTRRDAFVTAFEAGTFLAVPAMILSLQERAHSKPDSNDPPLFELEDLKPLQRLWVERMEERAQDLAYQLTQPNLMGRLFRWQDFEGKRPPCEWASEVGRSPDHIVALLNQFMNRGQMQGFEDLVATPMNSFHREQFEAFLPIEIVHDTLEKLDRQSLSEEDRKTIALFEQHAASWDEVEAEPSAAEVGLEGQIEVEVEDGYQGDDED